MLGSRTEFQAALSGLHSVTAKHVNIIAIAIRITIATHMPYFQARLCWKRRSMHAMLILVKVTLQTSRVPVIKLYFKIETRFAGGIVSTWWPYPSDMILQLRPKLVTVLNY
jgi:hypothetical protein